MRRSKHCAPELLRERLLATLVEQFLLMADAMPLIVVVEDLHWLDPTSRELLDRVVRAVAGHTVLLLLTTRPGFEAPWLKDCATLLPLGRLPGDAVSKMVQSLFGARSLPPQLAGAIARRTDGVPLFYRGGRAFAAATAGAAGTRRRPVRDRGPGHTGLAARVPDGPAGPIGPRQGDRAGRGGRRAFGAARRARGGRPSAGRGHRAALWRRWWKRTCCIRKLRGEVYTFTHALLRDAAYDSLLRDDRQPLHQRVARALQELDPHTVAAATGGARTSPDRGGACGGRGAALAGSGPPQPGAFGADRGDAPAAARAGGLGAPAAGARESQPAPAAQRLARARVDRTEGTRLAGSPGIVCHGLRDVPRGAGGAVALPDLLGLVAHVAATSRSSARVPPNCWPAPDRAPIRSCCCRRITATGRSNSRPATTARCCEHIDAGLEIYRAR